MDWLNAVSIIFWVVVFAVTIYVLRERQWGYRWSCPECYFKIKSNVPVAVDTIKNEHLQHAHNLAN